MRDFLGAILTTDICLHFQWQKKGENFQFREKKYILAFLRVWGQK